MLDDRNRGLLHNGADQAFAAARNHKIDVLIHFQQKRHRRMIRERDKLDHAIGHAFAFPAAMMQSASA